MPSSQENNMNMKSTIPHCQELSLEIVTKHALNTRCYLCHTVLISNHTRIGMVDIYMIHNRNIDYSKGFTGISQDTRQFPLAHS